MPFLEENINSAIVETQYDLRGFAHALGFRTNSNKTFEAIPLNFLALAVGASLRKNKAPTDISFISPVESDDEAYEKYLTMCKQFANDCNLSQYEAVQFIIKDIIQSREDREKKLSADEKDMYLRPLNKDNWWGKTMLALAEAFNVLFEKCEFLSIPIILQFILDKNIPQESMLISANYENSEIYFYGTKNTGCAIPLEQIEEFIKILEKNNVDDCTSYKIKTEKGEIDIPVNRFSRITKFLREAKDIGVFCKSYKLFL